MIITQPNDFVAEVQPDAALIRDGKSRGDQS
jgi:hypothetical protein